MTQRKLSGGGSRCANVDYLLIGQNEAILIT